MKRHNCFLLSFSNSCVLHLRLHANDASGYVRPSVFSLSVRNRYGKHFVNLLWKVLLGYHYKNGVKCLIPVIAPRQLPFPCNMLHLTAIQLPATDKLGTCKPKVCSPSRLSRQDACSPSCLNRHDACSPSRLNRQDACSPSCLSRQDACSPSCQCYIHGVSHKQ